MYDWKSGYIKSYMTELVMVIADRKNRYSLGLSRGVYKVKSLRYNKNNVVTIQQNESELDCYGVMRKWPERQIGEYRNGEKKY